jgi:hypothetical protein
MRLHQRLAIMAAIVSLAGLAGTSPVQAAPMGQGCDPRLACYTSCPASAATACAEAGCAVDEATCGWGDGCGWDEDDADDGLNCSYVQVS